MLSFIRFIFVNGKPQTEQLTLPILITISLPQQLAGSNVPLWHIHGDAEPERVTAVTFNEGKTKITFAADMVMVCFFI